MQVPMTIRSITVPLDSGTVLVDVDLGVPGAHGEFRFTAAQARQLGHDLLGAAHAIEPVHGRNAMGGRHFTLEAATMKFHSLVSDSGG